MTRIGAAAAMLTVTGTALALASPAQGQARDAHDKRATISPYIEVSQVLDAEPDDTLTYTQFSAGIDGQVTSRRVQAQLSYRFDERISWKKHTQVDQTHSGLARVNANITPFLQIEGGALATRSRTDIRGQTADPLSGSGQNLSQVYSLYAGPSLNKQVGPFGVSAGYRYGRTWVDTPDQNGVPVGNLPLDTYGRSVSHLAQASIGSKPGQFLPVGVSLSGAWEKENVSQLDQRYNGKYVRGDLVLPVSPTVALTAGVGYEDIKITQKDALLDASGTPVVDSHGRFETDPTSPNRIAYDTTGLFWDAGVLWRPSSRTTLEARVGRRYDSMTYIGSFSHQTGPGSGFNVNVYDSVSSFGRQLRDGISALPTTFTADNGSLGTGFSGCTFSGAGTSAGGCLNGALQSITSSSYRARGAEAVFVTRRGRNGYGIGFGYVNRRYIAPTDGTAYSVDGLVDESYYAQVAYGRQLTQRASVNASLYANYADPGAAGASDVLTAGGTATLSQSFGRLGAFGSLGAYWTDQDDDSSVAGQAQVGMRYDF